ncbi:hypothetical protein [Sporosarcina highlanderae]|uniref:Uncharacterized protein n=1 Tax=Sporosarcina highlanderae TaxID=3035916 RepID=A0ABT8JT22_9BACL|nr:hypothetical protein [Sporosarcina highlanderae]MDN4608316.1 hypothetical protein [Sporosarcina highlanderae]
MGLHGCCGISLGVNANPLPVLNPNGMERLISTVTITVNDADDVVRLMASIWAEIEASTVNSVPLRGNTMVYSIVRTSDNALIRRVEDTDFDELTTTFTAFDTPGRGTFTYRLLGRILRSTVPVQTESIRSVEFTAEELSVN